MSRSSIPKGNLGPGIAREPAYEDEHAVGIDVSKKKLDICIAYGDKIKTKALKNTASGHAELLRWLAQRELASDTPVVLEATGPYSEALATALADAGWAVSVVNPARIAGFALSELSRNKTDKADAKLLAKFAQRADLEIWQPPSVAVHELRALVDRLQALMDMRQQELNRARPGSGLELCKIAKLNPRTAWTFASVLPVSMPVQTLRFQGLSI